MPSKDITYCTCVECPLTCGNHIRLVPKGQDYASFAPLYKICEPYIALLLDEAIDETKGEKHH